VYVSNPNAENVVNPPNAPIIINSLRGKFDEFIKRVLINSPIIKQPIIFTSNVPIGKLPIKILLNDVEHKYLNIEPINPPSPIDSNIFNLN